MKSPMLSTTHAIFHGLQDDLRHSLTNLPNSAPAYLKTALVKAHRKLSNYYRTPEYRWGGLMRNLEKLVFRFGQNFQKLSIFVWMASGVRQKVQFLFRRAHQAPNRPNLFGLWQQASKTAIFVRTASTGTCEKIASTDQACKAT
jgi:hypothetical protein